MLSLKVNKRTLKGKQNKQLRREGIVPGAISRHKKETINIQASAKVLYPLQKLDHVEKIQVEIEGEKEKITTILTELIINPLNNQIESFLLTEILPESHVIVRVPIRTKGISPAVKNNLGVMVFSFHSVRLVVNSENIVPFIEIDISKLDQVGQRVLVADLELPEGVKLASAKDAAQTIVTIRPPQKSLKDEIKKGPEVTEEGEEATEGATESTSEEEATS